MIKRAFKERRKGFIPSSSRTAPRSWKNTLFLFFSLLSFLYFLALSFSSSSFFFPSFSLCPFFSFLSTRVRDCGEIPAWYFAAIGIEST